MVGIPEGGRAIRICPTALKAVLLICSNSHRILRMGKLDSGDGIDMGNRTSSKGGMFSVREIEYLESLPAVERVDNGRIRYTDDFKRECVQRYRAGESPSEIFRRSGLDAALIGYKRIERCMARWKNSARLSASAQPEEPASRFDVAQRLRWTTFGQTRRLTGVAALDDTCDVPLNQASTQAEHADEGPRLNETNVESDDDAALLDDHLLKLIIRQQARRIDELEHELAQLREEMNAHSY